MRRMLMVLAVVLAAASCGGDDGGSGSEVEVPVDDAGACVAEWDSYVGEWNELTIERDEAGAEEVEVDGQTFETWEEYAEAMGYPLTYEEHCPEG